MVIVYKFILLLFILSCHTLSAHQNFWEIKATALATPGRLDFNLFFSLEQLNAFKDLKIDINPYSPEKHQALITELITLRIDEFMEVYQNSRKIVPFIKNVNIYSQSTDNNENEFSPLQVDLNIELNFNFDSAVKELKIIWKKFPNDIILNKLGTLENLPPDTLDVTILLFDDNENKFILNAQKPQFIWQNKTNSYTPPKLPLLYELTTQQKYSLPFSLSVTLLLFLGILPLAKIFSQLKPALFLSLFISSSSFVYFSTQKKTISQPILPKNPEIVNPFMEESLTKIFIAATLVDNSLKWKLLNHYCTNEFSENFFIQNYKKNNERMTSFIENLTIENLKILPSNQIECELSINTFLQHLSHIHSKQLKFRTITSFKNLHDKWLIDNIKIENL